MGDGESGILTLQSGPRRYDEGTAEPVVSPALFRLQPKTGGPETALQFYRCARRLNEGSFAALRCGAAGCPIFLDLVVPQPESAGCAGRFRVGPICRSPSRASFQRRLRISLLRAGWKGWLFLPFSQFQAAALQGIRIRSERDLPSSRNLNVGRATFVENGECGGPLSSSFPGARGRT